VVLDFEGNPAHLEAFRQNQTLNVRRRPAHEAHTSVFTGTLLTLHEARSGSKKGDWIFRLPTFRQYEMTDFAPFLDGEEHGSSLDLRGSALDAWLLLATTASHGWSRDRLWNLKILFKWAERASLDGTSFKWIRKEMLDKWKSIIDERARQLATE
jgi:anaphase-promoting complex subunit 1